jgi:predicted nuclease of predicted toxin-antitoxin system
MRLLLDESIPVGLKNHLPAHQVSSVREMGWAGSRNGLLLARAARQFDVLITVDKNLQHQQNIARLPISVLVLAAQADTMPGLIPLVPKLESALLSLKPRSLVIVAG